MNMNKDFKHQNSDLGYKYKNPDFSDLSQTFPKIFSSFQNKKFLELFFFSYLKKKKKRIYICETLSTPPPSH